MDSRSPRSAPTTISLIAVSTTMTVTRPPTTTGPRISSSSSSARNCAWHRPPADSWTGSWAPNTRRTGIAAATRSTGRSSTDLRTSSRDAARPSPPRISSQTAAVARDCTRTRKPISRTAWTLVTGVRYSHDQAQFDGVTLDPTGLLTYAAHGFTGPIVPDTVLAALDEIALEPERLLPDRARLPSHGKDSALRECCDRLQGGDLLWPARPGTGGLGLRAIRSTCCTTELGIKSRFFGDSLQVDAALFDTDIRDRQSSLSLWAGPVGTQPLDRRARQRAALPDRRRRERIEWRPVRGLAIHLGGHLPARARDRDLDERQRPGAVHARRRRPDAARCTELQRRLTSCTTSIRSAES